MAPECIGQSEGDTYENRSDRRHGPYRIKAGQQPSGARARSRSRISKSGVNSVTGVGLADALKGASVVVDVTNSP